MVSRHHFDRPFKGRSNGVKHIRKLRIFVFRLLQNRKQQFVCFDDVFNYCILIECALCIVQVCIPIERFADDCFLAVQELIEITPFRLGFFFSIKSANRHILDALPNFIVHRQRRQGNITVLTNIME